MAYSKTQIEELFTKICSEIEKGRALRTILKDSDMPSSTAFYKWIDEDSKKNEQYARSSKLRIEAKFESIEADYMEEPQRCAETGKIDTGWVQLQRLKIDAKKWELSKLNPKKYGDKLDHTSNNEKINFQPIFGYNPLDGK